MDQISSRSIRKRDLSVVSLVFMFSSIYITVLMWLVGLALVVKLINTLAAKFPKASTIR